MVDAEVDVMDGQQEPPQKNNETTYDRLIYDGGFFEAASLANCYNEARLFGHTVPNDTNIRVLEMGCATGVHLLSLSAAYPLGEFIGIDLSSKEIEIARKRAESLGAANVRFEQMNILDLPEDWGAFDFIFSHGVFSWVPSIVQAAILRNIKNHLTPNGLAYIDANALPGSLGREALQLFLKSAFYGDDLDAPDIPKRLDDIVNYLDNHTEKLARNAFEIYRRQHGQRSWFREQILLNAEHMPHSSKAVREGVRTIQKGDMQPPEQQFISQLETMSKHQTWDKEQDLYPIVPRIAEDIVDLEIAGYRARKNLWFYIRHEHLEDRSESLYLYQIAERAEQAGLQFFAPASSTRQRAVLADGSPYLKQIIQKKAPPLYYWQALDILANTKFHLLLLTHDSVPNRIDRTKDVVRGMYVCLLSTLVSGQETSLAAYEQKTDIALVRSGSRETFNVGVTDRDVRMCFLYMLYRPWRFFDLGEVYDGTRSMLQAANLEPMHTPFETVREYLLDIFTGISAFGAVTFRSFRGDLAVGIDKSRPIVCPVARWFINNPPTPIGVQATSRTVAGRLSNVVAFSVSDAEILAQFDGTRTVEEVQDLTRRNMGERYRDTFVPDLLGVAQRSFLLITPQWNKTAAELRNFKTLPLDLAPAFRSQSSAQERSAANISLPTASTPGLEPEGLSVDLTPAAARASHSEDPPKVRPKGSPKKPPKK